MAKAPTEIRMHRGSRTLELHFDDARQYHLPCELLRVYSPSAEVRGHGNGERILQTGKKYVGVTDIEMVGNYAIRLVFDDGHDSGIYTWDYLRELGEDQDSYWQRYEQELRAANASRLPPIGVARWTPDTPDSEQ